MDALLDTRGRRLDGFMGLSLNDRTITETGLEAKATFQSLPTPSRYIPGVILQSQS